ncbi:hypothetical protein [Edaphobacter modestus]|uniref:Uncharacterized protein n=1 Tax=Edaphobacter modestus TaxID=388466 RepID=A0A4Q7YXQ9_9BACT|nr:hypothetical protein [Edaphobacter modestus]RZU42244.1 hypothetical protein BDD14_3798 [Edaphobacter modestus]
MNTPQRKTMPDETASAADENKLPPDWMIFSALNAAWIQSPDGTIKLMAERIMTFQGLGTSAAPAERVRARLIAQSYVQVYAVLQELNATYKKTAYAERKAT